MSQVQSKPEQHRLRMMEWLIATSHDASPRFDCAIGDANKGEGAYFRRDGLRELDVNDVNRRCSFLRAANSVGVESARRPLNIYISAASSSAQHWLMMDDLTFDECVGIAGDRAHMIVQTSPGRHHLWLATTRPVSVAERKACQQVLQQRLGGDAGSTSGDHLGRLAGFKNVKRNSWVNVVSTTVKDRRVDVVKLMTLASEMGFSALPPEGGVCLSPKVVNLSFSQGVPHPAELPALSTHMSPPKNYQSNGRDESRAEFAFACVYVQKKLNIEDGISKLAQRALDRKKRSTWKSAEHYARKTFEAAMRSAK